MSNSILFFFIALGFFALASLMLYLTIRDTAKWGGKLDDMLASLGFLPSPEDKTTLEQRLRIVNERSPDKRLIMHLYRHTGMEKNYTLHFCDYRFGSASGKARGAQQLVVCLTSSKLSLPRLTVEFVPQQTGVTGSMLRAMQNIPLPGLHRIETANPAFNQRYALYVAEGQQQKNYLPDAVINRLLSNEGLFLDAQGDTLILRSLGVDYRQLDQQKTGNLVDLAKKLFEDFG